MDPRVPRTPDSRVTVIHEFLEFCNKKCSELEKRAGEFVNQNNARVCRLAADASKLCSTYNLSLTRECWRLGEKLKALPYLSTPGGAELDEFVRVSGDLLEELTRILEVSNGVDKEADELHRAIDGIRDATTKGIDVDKTTSYILAGAGGGLLVAGIPLLVYGATAAGIVACTGGIASLVGKGFQDDCIHNGKNEVIAYTQLGFSAAPLSAGLTKLTGHLQALKDVLENLKDCVERNRMIEADSLRGELDDLLYSSFWKKRSS